MKVRIKGNSLRYRLTQSEVVKLWSEGFLEEHTELPGKTFIYSIATANGQGLAADFVGDSMILNMPKEMINELYNTNKIGFEGKSGTVDLLVEKDFVCIDKTEEDQSDHYPNPSISCQ